MVESPSYPLAPELTAFQGFALMEGQGRPKCCPFHGEPRILFIMGLGLALPLTGLRKTGTRG